MDVDAEAVSQALKDTLKGEKPKFTMEEMQAAAESMQKKRVAQQQAAGDKNMAAGKAFLEKNKTVAGVTTLPSGIQYKVITKGNGKSPAPTDQVSVHYRGTLVSGVEFDSSYKRNQPATFPVNQVIKGWQEILPMMKEGDKWEVAIPSDLAYGPPGRGGAIGPNETLIFEIELLSIKK